MRDLLEAIVYGTLTVVIGGAAVAGLIGGAIAWIFF